MRSKRFELGKKVILRTISKEEGENRKNHLVSKETLDAISGDGEVTLLCGNCRGLLAENIMEGQLENKIIQCKRCASYNEVRYPQLEILKAMYESEETIKASRATTARNISLRLGLDYDTVRKELREMINYGLVTSVDEYYYLTREALRLLDDLFGRMT